MNKNEIAGRLTEIGVLLELKGENPFKIRAYQSGARILESMEDEELDQLIEKEELGGVKGIGKALVEKITELHATGRLEFFEKLQASIEPGLVEMLDIPGLGAKKVRALNTKLGVTDIASLTKACEEDLVSGLAGFGPKSQEKMVTGIRNREAYGKRHHWWAANEVAQPILAGLRALPQVERAETAGSLRRGMETIGDLDFLVAAEDFAPIIGWFVGQEGIQEVTAQGETKTSVRFASGLQADLRIVPVDQFVFALHHFTGSKDHNVAMRQRALTRGLSLSEWGLVPAAGEGSAKEKAENKALRTPADNEEDLFMALGLHFIPPALREGLGEIEAAEKGALPKLVELVDLRGAFHNHTTASDGRNTLAEMTAAAEELGWDYLGIADHSKSSFQANGLSEERLLKQIEVIKSLNAEQRFKTHIFAGVECDILTDGRLDYADDILTQLDYVVASVHNAMTQDESVMTTRLIRAIEHQSTTMLGHMTGRILLRRESYKVDTSKVIDAAIANRVIIELNASPWRLDMDWRHWRKAAEKGLMCSINPDAHETEGLQHVAAGINSARKGWLTKDSILNTRDLAGVERWLMDRS